MNFDLLNSTLLVSGTAISPQAVYNAGPDLAYYSSTSNVSATVAGGTLAVGEAFFVDSALWFFSVDTTLSIGSPFSPSPTATGTLAASALRAYGTSLLGVATSHITIVSDRYTSKLARRLGAVEMNYGQGGTKLLDPANTSGWGIMWQHTGDRLPSTAGSDVLVVRPQSQPLQIIHYGVNDGGSLGSQSSFQTTFAATLDAVVRMQRAGFAFRDTDSRFTYSAGWSANATSTGRGGTSHSRGATSGTVTFTSAASTFLGGDMTFYALARGGATHEQWRCRAKINGGSYVTTVDATALGTTNQQSVVAIPVPDVPSGTGQAVELDFDTVGAGGVYFVGATLESQWPPLVLIIGQPTLPGMPPASETQLTQAVLDNLNLTMSGLPANWSDGRVRYVDLSSLNVTAKYYQDDVHFTPTAHAAITDLILTELARSPALDAGTGAGAVTDLAGLGITAGTKPDWSAPPGSQAIVDASVPNVWYPKSITAGDWVAATLA